MGCLMDGGHRGGSSDTMGGDGHGGSGIGLVGDADGHGGGVVRVGGGVLPDHRGLDDLLDLVDLVGLGNRHGLGDLDGVGPVDVLGHDHLPLDGNGHIVGGVIGHLVHLELGDDLGPLGGDDGVGAHGGGDLGVSDRVGGSGAEVAGRRGNDGGHGGGDGEGGLGEGHSVGVGLGRLRDVAVRLGLMDRLAGDVVLHSDLDGLGANLDGLVADDAVLNAGVGDSGAGVVGLGDVGGGRGLVHPGGDVGDRGGGSDRDGGGGGVASGVAGGEMVSGGSRGAHRQHGNLIGEEGGSEERSRSYIATQCSFVLVRAAGGWPERRGTGNDQLRKEQAAALAV